MFVLLIAAGAGGAAGLAVFVAKRRSRWFREKVARASRTPVVAGLGSLARSVGLASILAVHELRRATLEVIETQNSAARGTHAPVACWLRAVQLFPLVSLRIIAATLMMKSGSTFLSETLAAAVSSEPQLWVSVAEFGLGVLAAVFYGVRLVWSPAHSKDSLSYFHPRFAPSDDELKALAHSETELYMRLAQSAVSIEQMPALAPFLRQLLPLARMFGVPLLSAMQSAIESEQELVRVDRKLSSALIAGEINVLQNCIRARSLALDTSGHLRELCTASWSFLDRLKGALGAILWVPGAMSAWTFAAAVFATSASSVHHLCEALETRRYADILGALAELTRPFTSSLLLEVGPSASLLPVQLR
mmetsp:Transcript_10210/g.27232  ORF Transcript_10210/g.27232 Transcript_10210/m.27232 type:complete len:362 (+) Transcript_10210:52-1137(+)